MCFVGIHVVKCFFYDISLIFLSISVTKLFSFSHWSIDSAIPG